MTDPGGETQISGAVTMVPPVPRYEDEEAESLGEKLAELYTRRDNNPKAKIDDLIDQTRRQLRRGPRLRSGEFLNDGRYRLVERLGDSAGDATWKAWDRTGQCLVVVKEMVGPWVAKKMRVGAFLEAARTLQSIEHAGVARVHLASQSRDGFVYLVTDYFDGGTLQAGWTGDEVDALQFIVEVGNALQSAHERDLVHARVAPNNIHFGLDAGAHLADFDLAGEHAASERANVFVAPEVVEKGHRATPTSDVYSLAMCALFALNGGSLPYTVVRNPEKFIDILDVAEVIKDVLKRAVDWDVEQRFSSMGEFVDALLSDGAVLESLAERAFEKKRYVIASEHYTQLWALRPGQSVEIKQILGTIYLRMHAWEEAFECLSTALEETSSPETLFPLLREYAEGTGGWERVADALWNQARERTDVERAAMRAELARIRENQLGDPLGASEIWAMVVVDHRLPERGEEALRALKRLAEEREDWAAMVEHSCALLPHLAASERPDVQYAIGRAYVRHLDDDDAGLYWIDKAEGAGIQPLDMAAELQEIRARKGQWRRVIGLMRLEADHEEKVHNASRILLRAATIARAVHLDPEAEAIYENMLERAPQHYPAQRELARMRHRAGHDERAMEAYATLTSNYDGRSEEPEASERAADHTGYAELLVDRGRFEEAIVQLEAAMLLQPDNCEALKIAGPMYLDMGRLEEGAKSLERLYTLFKAVRTHGERLDAAIQRADAAWFRGRLAVAMRWYNVVLDTVPEHSEAWWGLAKVAMAARGGHPGADRAPWLANTPDRFTPQEALARLFMGLFRGEALSDWLSRHPLGKGVAEAGATSGRLACAAVDLMTRYGCVDAELFGKLAQTYPGWERRILAVETLWLSGNPEFRFGRSYKWARSVLDHDFQAKTNRIVLPLGDPIRGRLIVDFGTVEHWDLLVGSPSPPEHEPDMPVDPRIFEEERLLPRVEFLLAESAEFDMPPGAWEATIGSDPSCDWCVPELALRHAFIERRGAAVYIQACEECELAVDGESVPGWRLMGGETLQLGSNMWDVRVSFPSPESDFSQEGSSERAPLLDDFAGDIDDIPESADPTWEGVDPEASDGPALFEAAPVIPAADNRPRSDLDSVADDSDEFVVEVGDSEEIERSDLDDFSEELEVSEDAEVVQSAPPPMDFHEEPAPTLAPEEPVEEEEPDSDEPDSDGPVYFDASSIVERVRGESAADARPVDPGQEGVFEDDVPTTATTRAELFAQLEIEPSSSTSEPQEEDEEDQVATQIRHNPLIESEFADLSMMASQEDSLGPAGDAPTPQWVVAGEASDFDATQAQKPILVGEDSVADPVDVSPFSPPDLQPVEMTEESPGGFPSPPPAEPEPTPLPAAVLEIMSGPARGTQVDVLGVITLGRDEACEVFLPADPMLAPLHCRFVQTDDSYLVMDNGTERGTVVNGTRVSEVVLVGGETIMVGSTVLRFQVQRG